MRLVVEVTGRVWTTPCAGKRSFSIAILRRVDLATTLDWKGKKNIQLYQMFPLNMASPTVRYAVPYGWQELGQGNEICGPLAVRSRGRLPVARHAGLGRGRRRASVSVTLASECNMAAFRDLAATAGGRLPDPTAVAADRAEFRRRQPLLHPTGRTPLPLRLAVPGRFRAAGRRAQLAAVDLRGCKAARRRQGLALPERFSFARVESDHVQLAVVKRAEDGRGVILRLVETAKTRTMLPIDVQLFRPIAKAAKTSIIEENQGAWPRREARSRFPSVRRASRRCASTFEAAAWTVVSRDEQAGPQPVPVILTSLYSLAMRWLPLDTSSLKSGYFQRERGWGQRVGLRPAFRL